MQFQIEVLSVVGPVKNQKGKNSWNAVEIAYKKDGKIEGKKVVDFNGDKQYDAIAKEVFAKAIIAKQGEVYNVEAEKINDFWNWVGFERVGEGAAQTASESKASTPASGEGVKAPEVRANGGGSGRVTGSNYETPEERTVRQRHIARQSSLGYALTLLTHNSPKAVVEEAAVEALAERFVQFVYKADGVEGLKSMKDDIPY